MITVLIMLGLLALGLAAALFLAVERLHFWRTRRRLNLYQSGHCTRCGYDIRENPRRCPECGHDLLEQAVDYWRQKVV